jgi:hypothetical protein
MGWFDIITEADSNLIMARSFIMDILVPLRSQNVESITMQQILDQLEDNPEINGVTVDADLVMAAIKGVPKIKIERNAENGVMTVFLQGVTSNRQVDADQAEQDKETISKAAMRTIQKRKE